MLLGRCARIVMCAMLFAQPSVLLGDALSACARIFEAEIRNGVIHGADYGNKWSWNHIR